MGQEFKINDRYKFNFLSNGNFVITDLYCKERITIPYWILANALYKILNNGA